MDDIEQFIELLMASGSLWKWMCQISAA